MASYDCYDDCGYRWLEVGATTECTRDIDDGTVDFARLILEVIEIQVDPDSECEICTHEARCLINIYEHYTGDVSETHVFEGVYTVYYNTNRNFFKYNAWKVDLADARSGPPVEVQLRIAHKPLCPGCTYNYLCDCEEDVYINGWTDTQAMTPDDPSIIYEQMQVKLLSVAYDLSYVIVNVRVWDVYSGGSSILYDNDVNVSEDSFYDISQSNMIFDWRVCCNDIDMANAEIQLCYAYEDGNNDSGGGNGSGGLDGLVAAQYFDTRDFGYTGGSMVYARTKNPKSDGGTNNVPTEVRMNLYEWQGDYASTKNSTSLATQTLIIPSEDMEYHDVVIPFIWDYDAPPGEYMWMLTCLRGPRNGSFQLWFISYAPAQKFPAWVNGSPNQNFNSRILGIETEKSWGNVISVDDTFGNYYYTGITGWSNVKVKSGGEYKDVLLPKTNCNLVKRGPGSVEVTNPSFETGDFTGWTKGGMGTKFSVEITDEWSSDGTYSCKMCSVDAFNIYWDDFIYIYQILPSHSTYPGWMIYFDLYIPSSGRSLIFNEYHSGYTHSITAGTYLNESFTLTNNKLLFKLVCTGDWPSVSSVYIDNVRSVPPTIPNTPIGRMIGGASDIRVV